MLSGRVISVLTCLVIALSLHARRVAIHSHNDYDQARPFWGAYEAGAASIEADIWLIDGDLFVAHNLKDIRPERTLETMYLEPVRQVIGKGANFSQLLIDLKSGPETLDALIRLIEEGGYRQCFDRSGNASAVMLVITGSKIKPEDFSKYPEYVFFDGLPGIDYTPDQVKRVPLISEYGGRYTKWKGVGKMDKADRLRITRDVKKAHRLGCLFRLWGFPDKESGWKMAKRLGIDYINTDQPEQVAKGF